MKHDMCSNQTRMKVLRMKVNKAIRANIISDNNQLCAQTNTCFNIDTKKLYFLDYEIYQTYHNLHEITLVEDI